MEEGLAKSPFFGWADIAWTVAVLLGIWGAMIGVEEFTLANAFMILTGVICLSRLIKDCFQEGERRWVLFIAGLALICAVVAVDIVLTHRKQKSSEAREQEIPALQREIGGYQKTIENLSRQLQHSQVSAAQKIDDIQAENKSLRKSIEQKDAALVSIAKEQLDLNYAPEILVTTYNTLNTLSVVNSGKTNIELLEITLSGMHPGGPALPETISPASNGSFTMDEHIESSIVARLSQQNIDHIDFPGSLVIRTMDNRRYSMNFTVTLWVKDGKLTKCFATDGPIMPAKS